MKKILSMVLVLALVVCLTGCINSSVEDRSDSDTDSKFICIERTHTWLIVYHEETKVMYAVSYGGYSGGTFTLLVNADGSPMLYESED